MRFTRLIRMCGLAGLLALAGCAATPPAQFYQLQQGNPGLPKAANGVAVLLGPVKLADYLQRETLVQRQADNSLAISQQARWAGSLQDDVAQLLLRQLAGRLDSSRLALYPDRVGFKPEAQLLLSISRLDSGPYQPAVLEAQWRLLDGQGTMRDSRVVRLQEKHSGELRDQVRAQSVLLQILAGQMASAVAGMSRTAAESRAESQTNRGGAPAARADKPEAPRIPTVTPRATPAAEVYRF
jgi:uncharacterized lipoprotein YmbA